MAAAMTTTTTRRTRSPGQNYFPDALAGSSFYNPPERGFEREIRKRLDYWAKLRRAGRGMSFTLGPWLIAIAGWRRWPAGAAGAVDATRRSIRGGRPGDPPAPFLFVRPRPRWWVWPMRRRVRNRQNGAHQAVSATAYDRDPLSAAEGDERSDGCRPDTGPVADKT